MMDIEKIHKANHDIGPCKHEVIWELFGGLKFYIRIDDIEVNFIPYAIYPPTMIIKEYYYICEYIQSQFKWYHFIKRRGIFESLFIIEDELRRKYSDVSMVL